MHKHTDTQTVSQRRAERFSECQTKCPTLNIQYFVVDTVFQVCLQLTHKTFSGGAEPVLGGGWAEDKQNCGAFGSRHNIFSRAKQNYRRCFA